MIFNDINMNQNQLFMHIQLYMTILTNIQLNYNKYEIYIIMSSLISVLGMYARVSYTYPNMGKCASHVHIHATLMLMTFDSKTMNTN